MVDVVELVEMAGKVAGIDPVLASDEELCALVTGIEAARTSLDAASLAVLVELDGRGVTDTRFGLNTGAWLAREAKGSVGVARRRVRIARKIRDRLPIVADALVCRAISFEHVKVLTKACKARIAEQIADLQEELIELARGLGPSGPEPACEPAGGPGPHR